VIISKTPFRVSFFGGGTDYPVWFRENGGAVLSSSIDKYAYLTCRILPPFFEYHYRISYTLIELTKDVKDIKHPAVRACLEYLKVKPGVEIHYDGDIPARTGMGSSSAFTVGLLRCLHALKGETMGNLELGMEAVHVEQNVIPENVGCQDQLATAVGGLNFIEFGPGDRVTVNPVTLSKERSEFFKSHLMLFFTGFSRIASEIAGRLVRTAADRRKELTALGRMAPEAVKMLSDVSGGPRKDLTGFGEMLHESWLIKRGLTDGITNPELDAIYEKARRAGAVGGKLLGAGGGGVFLFFVKPEKHADVRKALGGLVEIPFDLENFGSQIVYYKPDEYENVKDPRR
jgi:D-glycero-alpha-D-manno-heptose-7-phosphate kinase